MMSIQDQKSSLMYKLFIATVFALFVYLNPRMLALLIGNEALTAKLFLILFFILLNLFWIFGIHYLFLIVFSLKKVSKVEYEINKFKTPPKVAICYVTKNDFQKTAIESCLNQNYKNFHVYILDDSTDKEYKEEIDNITEEKSNLTVLRRKEQHGFKAGNLNYGLKQIPSEYEFIAVVDADEIIPSDFIKDLIDHFYNNEKLAFVQSVNLSNPQQKTLFAGDLSLVNDIHWKYMVPARNKYGFVMFYGHGGIIRRSMLEEVGGFPEIVSEDIALSFLFRKKGYYGIYDENVICLEDTPADYLSYRKRFEKWVRGTVEFLKIYLFDIIKTKSITWFEKLDILMLNGSLFLSVPFFIFLLLGAFVLPVFFASKDVLSLSVPFFEDKFLIYEYYGMLERFSGFWFWDFFIIILLSVFAQYIPVVLELRSKPIKLLRYIKNSYTVSSGLIFMTFVGFWGGLLSKRTIFIATGDKNTLNNEGIIKGYAAEQKSIFLFEVLFGSVLLIVFFMTLNLWLLPVAVSLIISYLIYRLSWNNKIISYITIFPLACLILLFILIVLFLIHSDVSDIYIVT